MVLRQEGQRNTHSCPYRKVCRVKQIPYRPFYPGRADCLSLKASNIGTVDTSGEIGWSNDEDRFTFPPGINPEPISSVA
jgi:hypothetical protein